MSSIESSGTDETLRLFFVEKIVPAAERLRGRGVRFFETTPDAQTESYYVQREQTGDVFFEIEPEHCAKLLKELWGREGRDELVALADDLLMLAPNLRTEVGVSEDVSPFIYVMF